MPTGYTAKICEGEQSFEEFILTCARAFGATITMRDEPLDAPLPDEFQPDSFHIKALADSRANLAELEAMTDEQRLAYGQRQTEEAVARIRKLLTEAKASNDRLDAMAAQVREWEPPTTEHEGLKAFMLEQLLMSRDDAKYWNDAIVMELAISPMEQWQKAVDIAQRSIEYHEQHHAAEVERAKGRTEWVRALRESIRATTSPI